MLTQIATYFAHNKKIALPGIGTIQATQEPARLEFLDRKMYAPVYTTTFTPATESTYIDEQFTRFVARKKNITQNDAANAVQQFSESLRTYLGKGNAYRIPGIGTLKMTIDGQIFFEGSPALQQFFPDLKAEKIIRRNTSHKVRVGEEEKTSEQMHAILQEPAAGEKWWIAAVVLGVAGVAAILYYYLS